MSGWIDAFVEDNRKRVYVVVRNGFERNVVKVFSNPDSAVKYRDDKNDMRNELLSEKTKTGEEIYWAGKLYEIIPCILED